VTGPKYPSCDASRDSDGVGEGEITLGVPGTGFAGDMVKGRREGIRITPVRARLISATLRIQEVGVNVEWRCLSFLEVRSGIVNDDSMFAHGAIGSSWSRYAEQDCAASLKK
jgi:hypothetical protein